MSQPLPRHIELIVPGVPNFVQLDRLELTIPQPYSSGEPSEFKAANVTYLNDFDPERRRQTCLAVCTFVDDMDDAALQEYFTRFVDGWTKVWEFWVDGRRVYLTPRLGPNLPSTKHVAAILRERKAAETRPSVHDAVQLSHRLLMEELQKRTNAIQYQLARIENPLAGSWNP
jgi:hypothetical protein